MPLSDTELAVLQVIAGQSPGYLIAPDASAFVAAGLDAATVAETLTALEAAGYATEMEVVEQETVLDENGIPVVDPDTRVAKLQDAANPDGSPKTLDDGWVITDAGTAALPTP